jgi:hypothetical protein
LAAVASTPVHAQGTFFSVRVDHTAIELDTLPDPGLIDTTRTRPAAAVGYRFGGGFEVALEHWRASTGFATCPAGVPCPAIAIPTEVRLTRMTLGYEWPLAPSWTIGVRGGVESGEADYGGSTFEDDTFTAGATFRYWLNDSTSVGLDLAGSEFKSRSVGLEFRIGF